jgi:hypothetical protein
VLLTYVIIESARSKRYNQFILVFVATDLTHCLRLARVHLQPGFLAPDLKTVVIGAPIFIGCGFCH